MSLPAVSELVPRGAVDYDAVSAALADGGPLRSPRCTLVTTRLLVLGTVAAAIADDALRTVTVHFLGAPEEAGPALTLAAGSLADIVPPYAAEEVESWELAQPHLERVGESIAIVLHTAALDAWNQGRTRPSDLDDEALDEALGAEERAYLADLARARRLAKHGSIRGLLRLTGAHAARTLAALPALASAASALGHGRPGTNRAGLRVAFVVRRYAMLSAALPALVSRLRAPSTARTTPGLVGRRTVLTRHPKVPLTTEGLDAVPVGDARIFTSGVISGLEWIEADRKDFTEATIAASGFRLVVPHKSWYAQGGANGSSFWAAGVVKEDARGRFFEVEQEGPTQHSATVWEDWLAELARPFYDLYPGSLYADWELPLLTSRVYANDVLGRLPDPDEPVVVLGG